MDSLELSVQQLLLLVAGNPARGRLREQTAQKMVSKFNKADLVQSANSTRQRCTTFRL